MVEVTERHWVVGLADSRIAPPLVQAYLETRYHAGDLLLQVGQENGPLRTTHGQHGVASSVFITAWNPYSQTLAGEDNQNAQEELRRVVRDHSWQSIEGYGQHPSNGWPAEPSLLVFGPDLEEASLLGRQFGQNAVVWTGEGAVPKLVLLQ